MLQRLKLSPCPHSGVALCWVVARFACSLVLMTDCQKCQTKLSWLVVSLHQITAACGPQTVLQRLRWPNTLTGMCSLEAVECEEGPQKSGKHLCGPKRCPLLVWRQEVLKTGKFCLQWWLRDVEQSGVPLVISIYARTHTPPASYTDRQITALKMDPFLLSQKKLRVNEDSQKEVRTDGTGAQPNQI